MEPEKERSGRTPKKGRKRRRVPNKLVGASEVMRDRCDLEERQQPEAKKARLSTILFAGNREITHGQLCELLKRAVLGKFSVPKPSGCQLFHQNHLNNVVVFILQGMSQLHFYRFYLEFGFLRKAFRHKFCLPPPSSDFLADIIGLQKKQIIGDLPKEMEGINLQNDPIVQKYGSKKVSLTRCLLTKEEMKTYHFPLQGFPDCENFVPTKCCGSITDNSPLFGLDCEVCLTSKGRELTRISLVAEGGCCVTDELVKPDNKIVDYLTSFSGITKKILNPVTTTLKDVQRQLKALLPPDAVLVGHSLDLDLRKIAELNLEALASHQELEAAGLEARNTAEVVQQLNTNATELSSSKNCQTIKCLSNKEVLEQARVEIPLFTFSIVQFSFEPFPPNLTEEMSKRMRIKWMEMSTVYAGPFSKNCNLRALKRLFKSFGPVRSVTLILETHQPHLCIQYEILEGRDSERPVHRDEEWPPLATTRESPRTETKTQHSHK
uniref:Exonuclease domain-containing protein n=1 Tax=Balaenoptera musculus TaxID=9771 RepID=A0A8C0DZC4_BALMU